MSSGRDRKWLELYDTHKGQIDESFAFLAMRTAPLVSSTHLDAKVTTGEMASRTMLWAVFGKAESAGVGAEPVAEGAVPGQRRDPFVGLPALCG